MKKPITITAKLGLLCSLLLLLAFIPKRDEDPLSKLVTILQKWTDTIPQEKVYLHTDKPYYALGDTIWFKGYITIGSRHQLSALSGSLHVDLITEQDSVIRSLKLPITSGMVMGDFILNDDFKEGSYRIRAYTQWMRNAGEEYFYDHTFTVGSVYSDNVIAKADYQYKNVNNKQVLSALLSYTTDDGKALGDRNLRYEIYINKKRQWIQNVKTDALGNAVINIDNDKHVNLAGAYIRTTITGSNKQEIVRDFPIKANLLQSDVQFFPESGNLVNGLPSRVAFKAVGVDGTGIDIKGKVTDNDNNEVAIIQTLHAGMGSFTLHPVAGKTYTAKITFADGTTKDIGLPKATDQGYVLSVYQPNKDSLLVRVYTSPALIGLPVSLIAHSSGETVFATPIKPGSASSSIWLDKKSFPSGIAQFTLFDNLGDPLNERIAFIRSDDVMKLNLKTTKASYKSKERVQVDLQASDSKSIGTAGNFSVTVIDERKVPVDETLESTIFSNILLTSDLKGYVEKPNYYFTKETDEVNKALDNLMLTQGYRRFTWKEIANTVKNKPLFDVEGLGFKVSGRVTTLGNKPLADGVVSLLSFKAGVMQSAPTDEEGKFRFGGIFLTDSIKFALQARTAKGSDKVKILIDTIPQILVNKNPNMGDISTNINATLKAYIANGKKLDDIYEKTGQLDKVQRLKEVRIKAARIKPVNNITPQGMFRIPDGSADKVTTFTESEAANCTELKMCLQAKLQGVSIEPYGDKGYMALIDMRPPRHPLTLILDGRKLSTPDEVDEILMGSIRPEDVAKILLVRSNRAAVSSLGGGENDGFVMIMTKVGTSRQQYNPAIANISPKGFNKVREFYSPRYDRPGKAAGLPDLRSTIYWNPYLKTDTTGNASFSFFNADGPGNYKVIVEGINAAGELGRQVYNYTVEEGSAAGGVSIDWLAADKGIAPITAPLDTFNKHFPQEKVYLHTDKPYYNLGDTLWFKSYLVDRVNLSASRLSGLLYVELDNDSSLMVRRVSIKIKDGVAWGQIPLPASIFREGGYTLRAYTNWMQNFGEDYIFNQRFYLGVPAREAWLVKSTANVNRLADKDQLNVDLKLIKTDKLSSPVAFKKVEVRIYEGRYYLFKETMQTGIDGSLKFSQALKAKIDGRILRAQVRSLEKGETDKIVQVPLTINRNQNIDLQFLPEGGGLVRGLKSVIGFKAIGEDGKGTPALGAIYNSKGDEIVSFAAIHNGMGSFEFTPKAGEVYTARVSKPVVKSFEMPKITAVGTVMHITNTEQGDVLTVTLQGTNNLTTDTACYLIGTSRGTAYYTQKIDLAQPTLSVDKKLFPTGIARFTFFKGNRPLNERAVFIDNNDQLSIKVSPNHAEYRKRDSVSLAIEVKDKSGLPVQGNFSLAVTDDSQVRVDSIGNYGIGASLLINSELKGHVEAPGYYINRKDKQAWEALDNLMLTQGWTGYDWKNVFSPAKPPVFTMEKEFKITGKVINLTAKPVPNAKVLLSSQKPSFISEIVADDKGLFEFKNLPTIDSGSFFLQASKADGKKMSFGNVSVNKFKAPLVPLTLKDPVLPWYVNTDSTQLNYVRRVAEKAEKDLKLTGIVLKEVQIKDKKIIKGTLNRFGPGYADLIYDEEDIKKSATTNLYELLAQKIPGFRVRGAWGILFKGRGMAVPIIVFNGYATDIRIDGWPLTVDVDIDLPSPPPDGFNTDAVIALDPLMYSDKYHPTFTTGLVENANSDVINALSEYKLPGIIGVEIAYSRKYTNRLIPQPPYDIAIIEITTKGGHGWYRDRPANITTYRPLPVLKPQEFYSPRYKVAPAVIEPDYRSTIHWEPNISTDQNGKAKVSFYTSDITGKYTIKIAGIDATGGIGDGTFKVKSK
jgi:hypothetical protein